MWGVYFQYIMNLLCRTGNRFGICNKHSAQFTRSIQVCYGSQGIYSVALESKRLKYTHKILFLILITCLFKNNNWLLKLKGFFLVYQDNIVLESLDLGYNALGQESGPFWAHVIGNKSRKRSNKMLTYFNA